MSHSPQTLIDTIEEYIRASSRSITAGEMVEMDGLEVKVAELCAVIDKLPKPEGQIYYKKLEGLVVQLSELGMELKRGRDAVQEELKGLDMRRKASIAYGTTNVIDSGISKNKPEDGK